ncbi:MAG: hypothetical protein NDI67_15840, partial [Sulfuritalea sp.]|nr:hypothetical protein [Sulfuritalea sp.]
PPLSLLPGSAGNHPADGVEARRGWLQGGGRRQGQSLAKSDNAADAASRLYPQGRVKSGALRRCGSWRGLNIAALPRLASHPDLIPAPPSHDCQQTL